MSSKPPPPGISKHMPPSTPEARRAQLVGISSSDSHDSQPHSSQTTEARGLDISGSPPNDPEDHGPRAAQAGPAVPSAPGSSSGDLVTWVPRSTPGRLSTHRAASQNTPEQRFPAVALSSRSKNVQGSIMENNARAPRYVADYVTESITTSNRSLQRTNEAIPWSPAAETAYFNSTRKTPTRKRSTRNRIPTEASKLSNVIRSIGSALVVSEQASRRSSHRQAEIPALHSKHSRRAISRSTSSSQDGLQREKDPGSAARLAGPPSRKHSRISQSYYDRELRTEVISLLRQDAVIADIAREKKIPRSTVNTWKRNAIAAGELDTARLKVVKPWGKRKRQEVFALRKEHYCPTEIERLTGVPRRTFATWNYKQEDTEAMSGSPKTSRSPSPGVADTSQESRSPVSGPSKEPGSPSIAEPRPLDDSGYASDVLIYTPWDTCVAISPRLLD
ncbi:hypothetical protein EPUS_05865 [Endocarpon pusillum Z07020]|uniref:Uncharacterized protein n=1 Tax=Endocarpon pusillum (strain Z07020 / HMAS-L-300199) TaxID=1263415 RepID=U1GG15_ENDPU|nr:uncharacterized protein EPUS_05865 [Endocarpon pusillum Z07020]ERF76592.1 hypothetical protein EPUS_05865 [Endocarpon pusillum Z07020]